MGGMQVGGRGGAPMMAMVGGQQGPGQQQQSTQQGMSPAANATQAAEGAGEVAGAGGKGKGNKGKGKGKGKGGFQIPPGLAGRSYEELPPGIRKKVAPPQTMGGGGGCGMHGATGGGGGATGTPGQVAGATGATPMTAPAKGDKAGEGGKAEKAEKDDDVAGSYVQQGDEPDDKGKEGKVDED